MCKDNDKTQQFSNIPQFAHIFWDTKGLPTSTTFGDVYFSPVGGFTETEYVFIQGNNLEPRLRALTAGETFTIIETGFGTGLNMLVTLKLWQKVAPKGANLHFISTEKFPVTVEDMQKSHNLFEEKTREVSALLRAHYPNLIAPPYTAILTADNSFKMTLLIGDACESLENSTYMADAWFLDGFSPAKNPEMWNDRLYNAMFKCSKTGTTLATFTAASHVRQGLALAGFHIERRKGFAYKKHMTIGELRA